MSWSHNDTTGVHGRLDYVTNWQWLLCDIDMDMINYYGLIWMNYSDEYRSELLAYLGRGVQRSNESILLTWDQLKMVESQFEAS
jgi:hypothetical protein